MKGDSMLQFEPYLRRVEALEAQHRILEKAVHSQHSAGWMLIMEDLGSWSKGWSESTKQKAPEELSLGYEALLNSWTSPRTGFSEKVLLNRLRQNELILRVALFESFIKDVHRHVLRANPKLLDLDRKVELGRLVDGGVDRILGDEIERAVHALDRLSWEKRASHFGERLGIKCFGDDSVLHIAQLNNVRNEILHEDPDVVCDPDDSEYDVLVEVAWWATALASKKYPEHFAVPKQRGSSKP